MKSQIVVGKVDVSMASKKLITTESFIARERLVSPRGAFAHGLAAPIFRKRHC